MNVYGGGRCGRKDGMDDFLRVEKVVEGCDDGGGSGRALSLPFLLVRLVGRKKGSISMRLIRGTGWLVICLSARSGGGLEHLGGKSSREFKYGCGEVGGVVKMSSRDARGEGSCSCKASDWLAIGRVRDKARVTRAWMDGENMPIEASYKHSVGKHHYVIFDGANHHLGHVDGFLFSEIELHLSELHFKWIMNNHLTLLDEAFRRGSFIENDVTDKDKIIQRSEIHRIWIDAFRRAKNYLIVSNDKGNGNCLVDISSDPDTLVEFKNKQGANLFVDIQKTIKVDGEKDLANVGVIEVRRVNDTTFMKESLLKVLKDRFFGVRETWGLMMLENVEGGVLQYKDRKNNRQVKSQYEEQISMRELEYLIEEHYESDDDDDHDGTKDLRDVILIP
nr:hypothetical protein [Tanacetum cinerariifolium]